MCRAYPPTAKTVPHRANASSGGDVIHSGDLQFSGSRPRCIDLGTPSGRRTESAQLNQRASAPSSHRPSAAPSTAPDCRATSRPSRNRIKVGMLRMPYRDASPCSSSVFTLPTWSVVDRCWAVRSRTGAIILQGPHHGAQKSTRTGRLPRPVWVPKDAVSKVMVSPLRSCALHFGHFGCSLTRLAGVRTTEWH